MRKLILPFAFLILNCSLLYGQTTYVPDDNFEQALIDFGYDDVLDDFVLTANITGVVFMDLQFRSIVDLTGIEDFSGLTRIDCSNNQISSISFHPDVNLTLFICNYNPMLSFDLSQHTNLDEFGCGDTDISSLDLSHNPLLKYLYSFSTNFPTLDLTQNPMLRDILASNSAYEFVDLRNGNNQGINNNYFWFQDNPNLPYIYVDNCYYSTLNWTDVDPGLVFVEEVGDTECLTLGTADNVEDIQFLIYPNPVESYFMLEPTDLVQKVMIYTISGKLVKIYQNQNIYPISNLSKDVYILRVISENSSETIKLIKN